MVRLLIAGATPYYVCVKGYHKFDRRGRKVGAEWQVVLVYENDRWTYLDTYASAAEARAKMQMEAVKNGWSIDGRIWMEDESLLPVATADLGRVPNHRLPDDPSTFPCLNPFDVDGDAPF